MIQAEISAFAVDALLACAGGTLHAGLASRCARIGGIVAKPDLRAPRKFRANLVVPTVRISCAWFAAYVLSAARPESADLLWVAIEL